MHDPRKPRALRPGTLQVLVLDTNNFTRGLICEILRSLNVTNIHAAHDEDEALRTLREKPIDLILLSWEETDPFAGLPFVRAMRRLPDNRLRRLPAVLITSALTRQLIVEARDAGFDEFLTKPMSPTAMRQRLEMVIETPRPFVDCPAYLGPCRRRKNPADYYGAKRRSGDVGDAEAVPMVDADEEEAKTPIRLALAALRQTFATLKGADPEGLQSAYGQIRSAREIASNARDQALQGALAAFEQYVRATCPTGRADAQVMATALAALEQLATLPPALVEARGSVAAALTRAIQKKLAA